MRASRGTTNLTDGENRLFLLRYRENRSCDGNTQEMNIRTKLVLGLFFVLVVNLGFGFYAVSLHKGQSLRAAQIYALTSRIVAASLSAQVNFKKQVQEWKNILLRGNEPAQYDKYLSQFYEQELTTRETMEKLIPLLSGQTEAQRTAEDFFAAHTGLGTKYRAALNHFFSDSEPGHISVDRRVRGIDRQPTDLLDKVVALTHKYRNQQLAAIEVTTNQVETRILIIMLASLVGSILLAIWLIDRYVGQPLAAATAVAVRISSGDFSSEITVRGHDEAGQMLRALKKMQQSLEDYRKTLRKSEEQTRLLLDSTGEGIYGVDTEGHCVFCNPAGRSMFGYENDSDLLGKDIHAITHHTHPDGRPYPLSECKASQTYRDGRAAQVDDEVFWRSDGTSFPVEYRSFPIYHDHKLIGAVVTFADIAERKRAETELREAHAALARERSALAKRVRERTEELRIANAHLARSAKAKDEFLASMSHELRTPLTSILGISEILLDRLEGPLANTPRKLLKTIEESATHLLALISDILDVAKLEAGKMTLIWDQVPVGQLCEASLRLIRQSAQNKGITISSNIDPDVPTIRGDARRLKQLLVNLLSNAVKFTPEGGSIGLEVEGDPAEKQVRFSVWDTGIGIEDKQRMKLFKPFVQLDSKLSREYSGTGLGLALVYRMARLHGGRVSVESTPGTGSLFSVMLPWDPALHAHPAMDGKPSAPEDTDTTAEPSAPGLTVLLAEDDEAIMFMLTDYLNTAGYQVISAQDGVEAVAVAQQTPPDIVLMDIQMPRMDGLQAIRLLREDPAFRKIPIIALTALAMPGDRERCLEAGADDYLGKPVGLKELDQTIQSWIKRT